MNKIDKFIELLNSRKIAKKIDRLYEEDKKILFKKRTSLHESKKKVVCVILGELKTTTISSGTQKNRD